jgi:hypothetical protein
MGVMTLGKINSFSLQSVDSEQLNSGTSCWITWSRLVSKCQPEVELLTGIISVVCCAT